MAIWIKFWHYREQEENKLFIGDQEKIFNDLLEFQSSIVKEEKEGTRLTTQALYGRVFKWLIMEPIRESPRIYNKKRAWSSSILGTAHRPQT